MSLATYMSLQPLRCLEWGCGCSTMFFKKYLSKGAGWISVEHDRSWAHKVKRDMLILRLLRRRRRAEIVHIPPNHFPWTDDYGDGSYLDLEDYENFPGKGGYFDLILIDGRARKDCLIKACNMLGGTGIAILHDANREWYRAPFEPHKYQVLMGSLANRKDAGGLWLGSNGVEIKPLLSQIKP